MQLQLARWRRRVDAFTEADEIDANRPQLFNEYDEVTQVPAETIEAPAQNNIDPATSRVGY